MKKKLSFMLAVILILQIILPTIFVRADDNSKNKYQYNVLHNETEIKSNNQNYSKAYLEYLKLSDEEKSKLDVIPRKYDIPLDSIYEDTVEVKEEPNLINLFGLISKTKIVSTYSDQLPDTFNLRDEIDIPTKNQGQYGLCWAFASIRALETNLALHDYGDYDFSELHLGWLEKNGFGYEIDENSGGWFSDFQDYTSYNYGPVLESEMPYNKIYTEDEYDYIYNLESKAYIQETIDFPTIDKISETYTEEELNLFREKVKKHIMENGSIYATIASNKLKYINEKTTLYNTDSWTDHAISIIGWDDSFSKDNFQDQNGNSPKNDGAYIAVNSWGEYDEIYISYEDITVEREMSGVVRATTNKDEVNKNIKFEDKNLYETLKKYLGKNLLSYDDENMQITCVNSETIVDLDLENKDITNLTGLENFTNLTNLNLSDNSIENITALGNLTNLSYINLSNNSIEDITSLGNLTNLISLNLSNNNINNINFENNLNELYNLNLSHNNIQDVSNLGNLDNLENLDLSENPIQEGIDKLTNHKLYSIILDNCNLNNDVIDKLSNLNQLEMLEYISLQNNNITDINKLENLKLYCLDLSGNKSINVNTIPFNAFERELALRNCNISNISVFNNFKGTNLDLSDNPIQDLTQLQNVGISNLNLSNTNITDVSSLNNISNLNLSKNQNLTGLENLSSVSNLDLSNCNIEDISIISNLTNIEYLWLENNNISNINDLTKLTNLSYLELSNNNITEIPDFSNCEGLYNLGLSNNKITNIDNLKDYLPNVMVRLDNNCISEVPNDKEGDLRLENQKINLSNINIKVNTDNKIKLPSIIKEAYKTRFQNFTFPARNGYEGQTKIETDNCTIDFNKEEITINSSETGEEIATINVKGGRYDGTTYTINYNAQEELNLVDIEVINLPNKTFYIEGEDFDPTGMVVENVYEGEIREKTTNYSILNGTELVSGQESIIVKSNENPAIQTEVNIEVYNKDDVIKIEFPDKNLYEAMKENSTFELNPQIVENMILKYDDQTNTIIMKKEEVDKIKYMTLNSKDIRDISGLENFTNLETVELNYNPNLQSIDKLTKLENIKSIGILATKVSDIGILLSKDSITDIRVRYIDNNNVIKTDSELITLPDFIYQSLTMQENVTAEAYIYYDTEEYEGTYFTSGDNKESVEVKLDSEKQIATLDLDKEITEEKHKGIRGIEITINGGKTSGAICEMYYEVNDIVEPEKLLKGDANGDGKVDFLDILAINKHRLGKTQLKGIYLEAADVTGDNKADFTDILKINKYRLGKISSL